MFLPLVDQYHQNKQMMLTRTNLSWSTLSSLVVNKTNRDRETSDLWKAGARRGGQFVRKASNVHFIHEQRQASHPT